MASVPRSERTAARKTAYSKGLALPPPGPGASPGFPVQDAAHWEKARRAVGRVRDPGRRAALAKLLRKTAPRFGKTKALKQSWAAPGGASMANDDLGIYLAVTAKDDQGLTLTCPECGHVAPAGDFGTSGASLQKSPGDLRTPARGNVASRAGFAPGSSGIQIPSRRAVHALAGGTRNAVELAAGTLTARRHPISGPMDVLVARGQDGTAVLRHRHGGTQIASLRKDGTGRWVATVNGKELQPRDHQRTALMEAVGTYNKAVSSAVRPQTAPLQPPPQQTELMAEYGIPAIRALATPTTSSAGGPRMTRAASGRYDPDHDGDDDASVSGDTDKDYAGALGPKGKAAYAKLRARGIPAKRALALARHTDSPGMKAAS